MRVIKCFTPLSGVNDSAHCRAYSVHTPYSVGYFKMFCSSHHTIWNSTFVTWHLIPPLKSILMIFLKAGRPDLTTQRLGETLVNTHTLRGRKHRDGFAYEEVWASLSPFLCCSQLVTDIWQRGRGSETEMRRDRDGRGRLSITVGEWVIKWMKRRFPLFPPLILCSLLVFLPSEPTQDDLGLWHFPALSFTYPTGWALGYLHIWAIHLAVCVYAQVWAVYV